MTEITAGGTIYIRRAPTDGQPGKDGTDGQPGKDGADGKPAWSLRLADGSTSIALSTDDLTENAAHNFAVDAATDGRTLEIKAYYGNEEAYATIDTLEASNCAAAVTGDAIGVAKLKLKTISGQAAQYDGETATDTDGNPIYMPVGAATIALSLTVKEKLFGLNITKATLQLTIPITIAYTKDIARFYHDNREFTSQIAQLSTTADGLQSQVSEIKQTADNISLQVGTAEQLANSAKEAADNAATEAAEANTNATEAAKEAQAAAATAKETKDGLLATGINIKNHAITLTANATTVRNNAGDTVAVFNADGSLIAGILKTADEGEGHVEIKGGLLSIFYPGLEQPNIEFGIKDGFMVMSYYNHAHELLYDLGPNGLTAANVESASVIPTTLRRLTSDLYSMMATVGQDGEVYEAEGDLADAIEENYGYDIVGEDATLYLYNAAHLNGTALIDEAEGRNLTTSALAEAADGKYFTKTPYSNDGELSNLAKGIYISPTTTRERNTSDGSATKKFTYRIRARKVTGGVSNTIFIYYGVPIIVDPS